MDSLGDRMKHNYEEVTRFYLTRRTPVIVRLDGRAFHTLTRKCEKPFDTRFMSSMESATAAISKDIQGFKLAYIQSDEVSILITDYDNLETQGWFDYNLQKIVSISAAEMSVNFSLFFGESAVFDSRTFNVPREEVANYFLWRALDWKRNSISMYAQSFFSHKELLNKNQEDMHEMLYKIGKNWTTDLGYQIKNGTWLTSSESCRYDIKPCYQEIVDVVNPLVYPEEQKKDE